MPSRQHKREAKRKRKQRSIERRAQRAEQGEQRNEAARRDLEPLAPAERPTIVTVGAVIAGVLALSVLVLYATGATVETRNSYGVKTGEERASVIAALVPFSVMGLMAWGMWRARYWAVLGFQALMGLLMVAATLNIVAADSVLKLLANLVILALAGFLFYRMVKALARIQMPGD